MNAMTIKYPLISVFLYTLVIQFSFAQTREITNLTHNWKFQKGENEMAFQPDFDDSEWENVNIPHDWAIAGPFITNGDGNTGKLPWKGEGWYRTAVDIPINYKSKTIYLLFDGIMAFPEIYMNGQLAGKWDYGYNSFYLDVTDFLNFEGENILAIHVDTRNHDSRWYPGAGIYRKIQMIAVNPIHIPIWGTYITTPTISDEFAIVNIETNLNNQSKSEQEINIRQSILDHEGKTVSSTESLVNFDGRKKVINQTEFKINDPRRWDVNDPYLYTLVTEIFQNANLIESYPSTFGIREILFTSNDGFHLNGKRVQLKGVNLHHDFGPLGAAFNKRAMDRQLQIMQDMGCNAVRTSHNTAAPELLDLCDKMGILVFNEVFDKYDGKADITDTTDFENFAHRNIRNFIVRDRNHPSIFIWSVGNEIPDVQWNENNGFEKLQTMLKFVEQYDNTRYTTLVCDSYESAKLRHFDYYDVHCWNYGRRYSLARKLEPNKAVIISESASTLSTRGFYELPLPDQKTDFTKALQVSSYDFNAPEWAELADDDFMWQQQEPYVAGEFVWTGFDYIGEPTPYNNKWTNENGMTDREASRSSYFGIVDLCGIPKDRYYLYKSYWKPEETTIHILPHWNWEDRIGENVPVFVYTNGDCAELFINGESRGNQCKKPDSEISIERFRLMWEDVIYQPGEVKAVAFKDGVKTGEQIIKTTGIAFGLKMTPDQPTIMADGQDLSYILIEATDKDGNVHPLADNNVQIRISGEGFLAGLGNGNPQSMNSFKSDSIDLFYGKAMLIVQSGTKKGSIQVEISSTGLGTANTSIQVK
jgi:beta-galactosidase